MSESDLVLVDTGVWSAFFTKPNSLEKRSVDKLLDEDRVALMGPVLAEVALRVQAFVFSSDPHFDLIHELRRYP